MWIDVLRDSFASLKVNSYRHVTTANLYSDGSYRLLILHTQPADGVLPQGKFLKIFHGAELEKEITLPPTVDSIIDLGGGVIALAGDSSVYLFKSLKPHYKFELKCLERETEMDEEEANIWTGIKQGTISRGDAMVMFTTMQSSEQKKASSVLAQLLDINDPHEKEVFLEESLQAFNVKSKRFLVDDTITCMEMIGKESRTHTTGNLILGTELGHVIVLDNSGTREATRVFVNAPVQYLSLNEDRVLIVYCRDGLLRAIKISSSLTARLEMTTELNLRACCGLVSIGSRVFLAGLNHNVYCYTSTGIRQYAIDVGDAIQSIASMPISATSSNLLLVVLERGDVAVYQEENRIGLFSYGVSVYSLVFGKYGTEDSVLCTILQDGILDIKVLKRNFQQDLVPSPVMLKELTVDKQMSLEGDSHGKELHGLFQENLQVLKLDTLKSYFRLSKDGKGSFSENHQLHIQLQAEVYGLGPRFKLQLNVMNTGEQPIFQFLDLYLIADKSLYALEKNHIRLPVLLNKMKYEFSVSILCKQSNEVAVGDIQVLITTEQSILPILSILVKMPVYTADAL